MRHGRRCKSEGGDNPVLRLVKHILSKRRLGFILTRFKKVKKRVSACETSVGMKLILSQKMNVAGDESVMEDYQQFLMKGVVVTQR